MMMRKFAEELPEPTGIGCGTVPNFRIGLRGRVGGRRQNRLSLPGRLPAVPTTARLAPARAA